MLGGGALVGRRREQHGEDTVPENRELGETIERYADGFLPISGMEDAVRTLSAAKAPKKDGKGNPYVDRMGSHMPLLDAMRTASGKAFTAAFVD